MTYGSYVLTPHPDGEPLTDWSLRDPAVSIPQDEVKLEKATREIIAEILRAPISLDKQNHYIRQAVNHFRIGCVQESPRPKPSLREIEALRRIFVADALGTRVSHRLLVHFWISVTFIIITASFGLLLRSGMLDWLPFDHTALSNYSFVWLASMAAMIVNDSVISRFNDVDEFWRQERMLSVPAVRVAATGIVAEAIALGLASGALSIKVGKFDSSQIENSAVVALFAGFVAGLASSDLIKVVIRKAKRALSSS